jgi:hypothetical protein
MLIALLPPAELHCVVRLLEPPCPLPLGLQRVLVRCDALLALVELHQSRIAPS